jgi:hypothetical protein
LRGVGTRLAPGDERLEPRDREVAHVVATDARGRRGGDPRLADGFGRHEIGVPADAVDLGERLDRAIREQEFLRHRQRRDETRAGRASPRGRRRGALGEKHRLRRARLRRPEAREHLGIRGEEALDLLDDRPVHPVHFLADPQHAVAVLVEQPSREPRGLDGVRLRLRERVVEERLGRRTVGDGRNHRLPGERGAVGDEHAADREKPHRAAHRGDAEERAHGGPLGGGTHGPKSSVLARSVDAGRSGVVLHFAHVDSDVTPPQHARRVPCGGGRRLRW